MMTPLAASHLSIKPPSLLLSLRRPFRSSALSLSLRPTTRLLLTPASASNPDQAVPAVASEAEIEMLPGRDGVYSARPPSVIVLWDLDNKPPRGPPFHAASSLRRAASFLGHVEDISAYANHHAFSHLPDWVRSQRRDRRRLDLLEKRGLVTPSDPYSCGMCGRKFTTRPELKRHFKQLHERERTKKLNRMQSLKGKKKQRYRERYITGNHKYEESARELVTPKTGYGLASELRRAGVHVRTVEDKPQAADVALMRHVRESLAKGVDWMVLVSDDSDFIETVNMAREAELRTVVIGDGRRTLGRAADIWLPWVQVENGEVGEEIFRSAMKNKDSNDDPEFQDEDEGEEEDEGFFTGSWVFGESDAESESDFDGVIEEIVVGKKIRRRGRRISAFSEEEMEGVLEEFGFEMDFDEGDLRMFGSLGLGEELFWDGED